MKNLLMMAIAGALLAGCAVSTGQLPAATGFPPMGQYKLQSAAHWQAIAVSLAKRLSSELKEARPLYLLPAQAPSPFDKAFVNHFASALLDEGFTLYKSPNGALLVEVSSQTIHFNDERFTGNSAASALPGPLPSSTEIVVSVAVLDATRQVSKHSAVYYVPDGDVRLYQPAEARKELPTRNFMVVGQ